MLPGRCLYLVSLKTLGVCDFSPPSTSSFHHSTRLSCSIIFLNLQHQSFLLFILTIRKKTLFLSFSQQPYLHLTDSFFPFIFLFWSLFHSTLCNHTFELSRCSWGSVSRSEHATSGKSFNSAEKVRLLHAFCRPYYFSPSLSLTLPHAVHITWLSFSHTTVRVLKNTAPVPLC